jgi:diguanylate cyclase (GGDEF)-like protein
MAGMTMLAENALLDVARQNTISLLSSSQRSAARAFSDRLGLVTAVLTQSSMNPAVKEAVRGKNGGALVDLLQKHAVNLPFADVWLAVDAEGNVIARRNGSSGDQVALNNILPHVFNTGETVTSTEILSRDIFLRENPERYLRLERVVMGQVAAVPVLSNREVVGALVGVILLNGYDWLPNLVHDSLSTDARQFGAIVQESRVIATSQRPGNFWAEGVLVPAAVSDPVIKGKPFNGMVVVNDIPCFVSVEPVFNFQKQAIGALAVGVRADRFDDFARNHLGNLYLFLGLGVLLSIVIAYFAYRDTIKPIRALVGAMDDFADGNLSVRTEILTKDEFEDLGKGFNRMADAIHDQQERVEKYNSLAKLLITTLNPKELLKNALDKVLELTHSELGAIYLFDTGGNVLEPFVTHGVDAKALPALSNGEGIAGYAAQERRTVVLEHIPEDCYIRVNAGFAQALPSEVAAFPLMYKEKILGVMLLGTFGHYHAEEVPLVEYLANQIAITLDNALTHEKVERLSITDGLTGLYNRRYLGERLEQEFSRALRYSINLSILIMDVDFFKKVNDAFGHQVGDNALVTVARTLQQTVRGSDLIARYGGEEFVVVLPNTGQEQALVVAEKIRAAIADAPVPGMGDKRLTISVGLASYPALKADKLSDLVRAADAALYTAKESGRDRVVVASADLSDSPSLMV